ncbi:MAG: cytochrome P450 [Steroidobacteraceae bacterium]
MSHVDLLPRIAPEDPHWFDSSEHLQALHELRRVAPVYLHDPRPTYSDRFWMLTRWDDCKHVYQQPQLFSSRRGNQLDNEIKNPTGRPDDLRFLSKVFGQDDPPEATRLRHLFLKAFGSRNHAALEASLRAFIRDLVLQFEAGEATEMVDAFAKKIPLFVIRTLLGVEAGMDASFHRWTHDIALAGDMGPHVKGHSPYASMLEMFDFFECEVEARRTRPRADFITAVIDAEVKGDRLTPAEQLMSCWFLLAAGNHTTQSLISLGIGTLAAHPVETAKLIEDPSAIPMAVEELLRWTTPSLYQRRTVTVPTKIRGQILAAGDIVYLSTPACNRDPAVFSDPDRLDLSRKDNPHLSFSHGAHLCLGAPLARLEMKLALAELFSRFKRIELAAPVQRSPSTYVNHADSVQVVLN